MSLHHCVCLRILALAGGITSALVSMLELCRSSIVMLRSCLAVGRLDAAPLPNVVGNESELISPEPDPERHS